MNYVISLSYGTKIIVPMNEKTSSAISLLFKENNHYESGYKEGTSYAPTPDTTHIAIISDEELARCLARA